MTHKFCPEKLEKQVLQFVDMGKSIGESKLEVMLKRLGISFITCNNFEKLIKYQNLGIKGAFRYMCFFFKDVYYKVGNFLHRDDI